MPSSALTEEDIANMALTMLGQQPINSLSDTVNRAVMANARYADVRDMVLRAHPWNCAIKRDTLALNATAPEWGYSNTFSLPVDFVRLVSIEDPKQQYSIEAGNQGDTSEDANELVILSDASEMKIRYVYQLTDVTKMDHTLKHAIATRLAAELAMAISGDSGKEAFMMEKYQMMLMQAQWEDSVQHNATETIHGGLWIEARAGDLYRDFPDLDAGGLPA